MMSFELHFLTSSNAKLFNAIHWASGYNVIIRETPWYGRSYEEPRVDDRDELLKRSVDDAIKKSKGRLPFFIEDTSVRIEALSEGERDVPGLEIKYWMNEIDFRSLDLQLKERGNNRSVTVRSDIVLYLPANLIGGEAGETFAFNSSTKGKVSDREFDFIPNTLSPWLDSRTFNKWFVPDGFDVPISMLAQEDADRVDFRRGALLEMFKELEDRRLIWKRRQERPDKGAFVKSLFGKPLVVVVGLPCAGKTTFGRILNRHGYHHFEASDFMHAAHRQRHGLSESPTVQEFASELLKKSPGIVAHRIAEELEWVSDHLDGVVITGFRSPAELHELKTDVGIGFEISAVFIEADEEERFRRAMIRDGLADSDKKVFLDQTATQLEMGLAQFKSAEGISVVANNGSMNDYERVVLSRFSNNDTLEISHPSLPPNAARPSSLEEAVMIAMLLAPQGNYTTTQIAGLVNETFPAGVRTSKTNVSRFFNQRVYPYYTLGRARQHAVYRLSSTGRSRAQLLLKLYCRNQ